MPNEIHRQIIHGGHLPNPDVYREPPLPEKTGKLEGIRTNAWTGETTAVELEYYFQASNMPGRDPIMYVHLRGGPTGHESAPVGQLLDDMVNATYCSVCERVNNSANCTRCEGNQVPFEGWTACAGTPRSWDTLWITKASILRELL